MGGVEIHVVFEIAEGDAVFRLFVDFFLGMIGAEVAFAAVLRLPRSTR
jgi:hypothetical protein